MTSGQLLRKTSLDELPQLISILKVDMNFVGTAASFVQPGRFDWAQDFEGNSQVGARIDGMGADQWPG